MTYHDMQWCHSSQSKLEDSIRLIPRFPIAAIAHQATVRELVVDRIPHNGCPQTKGAMCTGPKKMAGGWATAPGPKSGKHREKISGLKNQWRSTKSTYSFNINITTKNPFPLIVT